MFSEGTGLADFSLHQKGYARWKFSAAIRREERVYSSKASEQRRHSPENPLVVPALQPVTRAILSANREWRTRPELCALIAYLRPGF